MLVSVCGLELGYLMQGSLLPPYTAGMAAGSPSFLMNGPGGKEFRMLLVFSSLLLLWSCLSG